MTATLKGEFRIGTGGVKASVVFVVLCWMLWKNRNNFVFQQRIGRVKDTIKVAEYMATNINR